MTADIQTFRFALTGKREPRWTRMRCDRARCRPVFGVADRIVDGIDRDSIDRRDRCVDADDRYTVRASTTAETNCSQ
jgi:hypothetical protein